MGLFKTTVTRTRGYGYVLDLQSTYVVSCNRRREEITAECHRGWKTYLVGNGGDRSASEQVIHYEREATK